MIEVYKLAKIQAEKYYINIKYPHLTRDQAELLAQKCIECADPKSELLPGNVIQLLFDLQSFSFISPNERIFFQYLIDDSRKYFKKEVKL